MTETQKTLSGTAIIAAALAIGTYFATGTMPDAPIGGKCSVSWAVGPCEAAIALSSGDVVCEPGSHVTMPVEIVATGDEAAPSEGLPSAFIPVDGSSREVDCATLTRPGKVLTVVPLAKHGRHRDRVYDFNGNLLSESGPICPPVVIAGHEPPDCK